MSNKKPELATQSIATGERCKDCLLIDLCRRGGQECFANQKKSDEEDSQVTDSLANSLFRRPVKSK